MGLRKDNPQEGESMSTSLLYHAFGVVGCRNVSQTFEGGQLTIFLRELGRRQQRYVAEVPTFFMGWLQAPRLTDGSRRRWRLERVARYWDRCRLLRKRRRSI